MYPRKLVYPRLELKKTDGIVSAQTSPNQGLYLYAIVEGDSSQTNGLVGIAGGDVYTISSGGVSAVVSDVLNQKIRPERRHLAAHQSVLKQLMTESTPLPMSFGIIADGPDAIQRILSLNQEAFQEQIESVQGKVEMGLRVTWDVPNIFDYFVNTHPALRAARDTYFGTQDREPTQEEKIELGRMFDHILNQDREGHTDDVVNVLSRHCVAIRQNKCRTEREVMKLACLVAREAEARFEDGILQAAGLFDNNFAFDYGGPWAPHNFVDIDLKY